MKVRFTGQAARYIREYESERATRLKDGADGELFFEKDTTLNPEIVRWVLSYGSGAEVLDPPELRTMLEDEVRKLDAIYKNK